MKHTLHRRGASAVEFGLAVGLVAVLAIAATTSSGESIRSLLGTVQNEVAEARVTATAGSTADTGANACDATGLQPGDACPTGEIYLGDGPAGGPLFAAAADLPETKKYYPPRYLSTGATDPDDGRANAATLFAIDGENFPAAEGCADLSAHGHDDWYLPAANELHQLWTQRDKLPGLVMTTSWSESAYWSSTEDGEGGGDYIRFTVDGDGSFGRMAKSSSVNVRCVRR